jgi:3-phenylpropionate/trans-cinnamate dioxygenase ferredoxin reductase subunit
MTGGVADRTLRQEGFDGRIVLIGDEPGVPFGRPPLSKTYLRGEEKLDEWLVEPGAWYADNDVERLGAAVHRVAVPGKRLEINGSRSLGFDSLLIATGGAGTAR